MTIFYKLLFFCHLPVYIDYSQWNFWHAELSANFKYKPAASGMNRTFLIFLMVGTALLIAVIGGEHRSAMPGYMPWEVKVLNNGNIRVFGITLNKTRIQEANQILSSFPETRLINNQNNKPALYAVYDQLNLGGLIVQLELQYDVDDETLQQLTSRASTAAEDNYATLPDQLELELLDARVRAIRYIPEIDYSDELILQHFGQPAFRPAR